MQKKYTQIFIFSIAAVLLLFYIFDEAEEKLLAENESSPATRNHRSIVSAKPATDDDVIAAILIMPKSYLSTLKRLSHSKMAKNIKILPAQIQLRDGEMTAVPKDAKEKILDRGIAPGNDLANKTVAAGLSQQKKEKQRLATGFLILLANVHKSKLYR